MLVPAAPKAAEPARRVLPGARVAFDDGRLVARYTWVVGAATLVAALTIVALGQPSPRASAFFMVFAVGLVGLPHGAYDLEVGRRLFTQRLGRWWWCWFGAAYLLLVGLAAGLWLAVPMLGLVMLLVGGSIHWGVDDLENAPMRGSSGRWRRMWLGASRGSVPVAAPMLFSSAEVSAVFGALLGGVDVSASFVRGAAGVWLVLAVPGLVAASAGALRLRRSAFVRSVLEPMVLLAWFAVVPAILGFAVYFCFWHAVRHSMRSAVRVGLGDETPSGDRTFSGGGAAMSYIRAVAAPTVLTWVLAAAAWFMASGGTLSVESMWAVVFVGLFALTVPHVLLEVLESSDERSARSAENGHAISNS